MRSLVGRGKKTFVDIVFKYGKPICKRVGKRHLELLQPCEFTIEYKRRGKSRFKTFRREAGFRWDGATIPEALWPLVEHPTHGKFRVPSFVHDILCNIGYDGPLRDDTFYYLLKQEGVREADALSMHKAVYRYREGKTLIGKIKNLFRWRF